MGDDFEYVIDSSKKKLLNFRELWQYRELFYFFTWRDVKVKYKQTTLGLMWVIIQPLLTVFVFSFFFGRALKTQPTGLPYPLFVFSGLLTWTFFSASVNSASNSMINQAGIIKKIYFPRLVVPVSSVLVSGIDFLIAFIVFIGMLIFYQTNIDITGILLYWPLSFLIMICGTLGISCWLAALTVKYRDFRYVVPFTLQIVLFLSPVIYPSSIIQNIWIEYILALNPMYSVISFFRVPFMGYTEHPYLLLVSVASSIFFLVVGIYYFKRTEDFFADIA
jgi:lipopolysaccharide transport system permease protein